MSPRIGAGLMIVVAAFLMNLEVPAIFGHPDIAIDYTVTGGDGALIPVRLE